MREVKAKTKDSNLLNRVNGGIINGKEEKIQEGSGEKMRSVVLDTFSLRQQ